MWLFLPQFPSSKHSPDLPSTRRIACCSIGVRCASPLAGDLNLQKAAAAAGAARQAEVLASGFCASGEEIIAAVARGSKERPPQCVSFFTIWGSLLRAHGEGYQDFFRFLLNVHRGVHRLQVISEVIVKYLDYLLQIIFLVSSSQWLLDWGVLQQVLFRRFPVDCALRLEILIHGFFYWICLCTTRIYQGSLFQATE